MKKSYLPVALTLLLLPQILISQDSMDTAYSASIEDILIETNSDIPKSSGDITSLKSFELVESSRTRLKVLATFFQKIEFELKIFNVNGVEIYVEKFETDDLSLSMGFSNLPEGQYFVSLKTVEGEIVRLLTE